MTRKITNKFNFGLLKIAIFSHFQSHTLLLLQSFDTTRTRAQMIQVIKTLVLFLYLTTYYSSPYIKIQKILKSILTGTMSDGYKVGIKRIRSGIDVFTFC